MLKIALIHHQPKDTLEQEKHLALLEEANVVSILTEALTAQVQAVLAN